MNKGSISLAGALLSPMPSGALYWAEARVLCVSDLHLCKSERMARRTGSVMLPPYETEETLARLEADIDATDPETVICLGDSFDDSEAAAALPEASALRLMRLQAGRSWIWIEGNHDPHGTAPGGSHRADVQIGQLTFRHIAISGATGEISGHYHPKITVAGRAGRVSRPCFLFDKMRLVMPAFGAYTGGLRATNPDLRGLFGEDARALLTGAVAVEIPLAPVSA